MKNRTRRQQAILRRRIFISACALILVCFIALIAFIGHAIAKPSKNESSDMNSKVNSSVISETESNSKKPSKNEKESYATVLSTGDIMVHSTQLTGALVKEIGGYDFSAFYKYAESYLKNADLSVANLELTFGGTESGEYRGYPAFNTPDVLADNLINSGFNFFVTANNHSYDTGLFGLKRTAKVLKSKNIPFVGTKEVESDPTYIIKNINGIKIGIADYTYETPGDDINRKYMNGNIMKAEANNLISSFGYNKLDKFYAEADSIIKDMKKGGADFIFFYMHWGNEYWLKASNQQKQIAQKLTDLGVDMILGSHPHVIEPVELITSTDGKRKTVCLYSMGNAVSNQRQEIMDSCPSGHTEDGMFFTYTLKKKGDTVTLQKIDLIPTWVNKYRGGNQFQYSVYPLEAPDWGSTKYKLDSTAANKASKSYERTKQIVKDGLTEAQNYLGCEVTFK